MIAANSADAAPIVAIKMPTSGISSYKKLYLATI